jgi:hypothetical protein
MDIKFEQVFRALENKTQIPTQGVFCNGQVFDAYELSSRIIRTAKTSIILIDNYVDESTIVHLAKKHKKVQAIILTNPLSPQLQLDIEKANQQYGNAFKQLNEEMFQNAQTQALEGFKDTTSKLAGTASEERKQYLQEWIAKNKLKTRDFLQGPDGSYYYEGPDGKLVKVS